MRVVWIWLSVVFVVLLKSSDLFVCSSWSAFFQSYVWDLSALVLRGSHRCLPDHWSEIWPFWCHAGILYIFVNSLVFLKYMRMEDWIWLTDQSYFIKGFIHIFWIYSLIHWWLVVVSLPGPWHTDHHLNWFHKTGPFIIWKSMLIIQIKCSIFLSLLGLITLHFGGCLFILNLSLLIHDPGHFGGHLFLI